MDLDKLFMSLRTKEEKLGYNSFNDEEKIFIDLMLLWYEVGNGGLKQYYENTGSDVVKIPCLLNTIGAIKLAESMETINHRFKLTKENTEKKKRIKLLNKYYKKYENIVEEFDQIMNDQDEEDIEELLQKYIEENKKSFE